MNISVLQRFDSIVAKIAEELLFHVRANVAGSEWKEATYHAWGRFSKLRISLNEKTLSGINAPTGKFLDPLR